MKKPKKKGCRKASLIFRHRFDDDRYTDSVRNKPSNTALKIVTWITSLR